MMVVKKSKGDKQNGSEERKTMKVVKRDSKEISVQVWAVKDYPISIETLRPLFHILGFASKNISKFNDFLYN